MVGLGSRKRESNFISAIGITLISALIAALLLITLPREDPRIVRLRQISLDLLSPVLDVFAIPFVELREASMNARDLVALRQQNMDLREENRNLRSQLDELTRAKLLLSQYRKLLALPAEPNLHLVSARVIADLSSPFVRTLVANTGKMAGVEQGQAVLGNSGLVGRVVSSGRVSSRILLLTDFNSHVPVVALSSGVRAILSGTNSDNPELRYLPRKAKLKQGDLLVTSGDGGQMPIGLPVGTVQIDENGGHSVKLREDLSRLDYVRVALSRELEPPPDIASPINAPAIGKLAKPSSAKPGSARPGQ